MTQLKTTVSQLREGCLLSFIAHAISMSHDWTELEHEQSWTDRDNYACSDMQGSLGFIRFVGESCVGVVFDVHSDRFAAGHVAPDLYTNDAPAWVQSTTHTMAPRLYINPNALEEGVYPATTGSFWGDITGVFSCDTWEDFIENGGHLFRYQMSPLASAVDAFTEENELTTNQVRLLNIIFERKRCQMTGEIILACDEISLLGCINAAGEAAMRRCLAQINVTWDK